MLQYPTKSEEEDTNAKRLEDDHDELDNVSSIDCDDSGDDGASQQRIVQQRECIGITGLSLAILFSCVYDVLYFAVADKRAAVRVKSKT